MQKHQQLVTSLGATVVLADTERDFLIAEHDAPDENHGDEQVSVAIPPKPSEFSAAVKSLLTSTTCHKF